MTIEREIEQRLQAFVAEIAAIVRRQAMEAVAAALGTSLPDGARPAISQSQAQRNSAASKAQPTTTPVLPRRVRKKGEKRTPAEFAAIENALLDYVTAKPGLRIEQIAKALETTTSELARPARRLIARGVLRTTGQKRATKYYPVRSRNSPAKTD